MIFRSFWESFNQHGRTFKQPCIRCITQHTKWTSPPSFAWLKRKKKHSQNEPLLPATISWMQEHKSLAWKDVAGGLFIQFMQMHSSISSRPGPACRRREIHLVLITLSCKLFPHFLAWSDMRHLTCIACRRISHTMCDLQPKRAPFWFHLCLLHLHIICLAVICCFLGRRCLKHQAILRTGKCRAQLNLLFRPLLDIFGSFRPKIPISIV